MPRPRSRRPRASRISNWQFQTTNGDIYTEQLTRSFFEIPDRFTVVGPQTFRTGPVAPQHRSRLHAPSRAALLDPHGRRPEQGRRLGQRPPLRSRRTTATSSGRASGAPDRSDSGTTFLATTGLDAVPRPGRRAQRELDAPWTHTLDFHYDFEIPVTAVKAQITFDVLNLINLIDSDSGLLRYVN